MKRDDGSTLPLILVFGLLSLALVFVVIAATSLYVERKRLYTLADAAALVGAESFALDDVTVTSEGVRPALASDAVNAAVSDYLDAQPHNDFDALEVERAESVDGVSATVELSAWWSPPIVSEFVPSGFRIEVTSVARSVFG